MIYRIDLEHFLTHMIDYFTLEDIYHFQYLVISAGIGNQGMLTASNGYNCVVAKIPDLYPLPEIITSYVGDHHDKKLLEKMYMDQLDTSKSGNDHMGRIILKSLAEPLLNHFDIMIVCRRSENDYIDIFCKYLRKRFGIDVIDLNQLFREGRVGPIYIDRKEIRDNIVDIRREALKIQYESLSSTRDGRFKLLGIMSKKTKIKKLNELGISVKREDEDRLDRMLIDAWVDEDDD